MHMCTVCGNDATTTLYTEFGTMYACGIACETTILNDTAPEWCDCHNSNETTVARWGAE